MSGSKKIYCTSCEVYIQGQEEYKVHFQSDFHKYNCKRKLVSLAPLSHDDFEAKKARITFTFFGTITKQHHRGIE